MLFEPFSYNQFEGHQFHRNCLWSKEIIGQPIYWICNQVHYVREIFPRYTHKHGLALLPRWWWIFATSIGSQCSNVGESCEFKSWYSRFGLFIGGVKKMLIVGVRVRPPPLKKRGVFCVIQHLMVRGVWYNIRW